MRQVYRFIRYSSVGMFFAGIGTVLAGCTEREGALFGALLLLLGFCTGPGDTPDAPSGFTGNICNTPLDVLEFEVNTINEPDIIEVGNGIYAIAYEGVNNDGFVVTVSIDAAGNIGPVIDSFEYNTNAAFEPSIIQVGDGVFAIAYFVDPASGLAGFVTTLSIDAAGNIAAIETFEYFGGPASFPDIIQVGNGIYAIVYQGPDSDGFVTTLSIDATGDIGAAIIDTFEFDTATGRWPEIIQVGSGIFAIAYQGPGDDGFVTTISIDAAGNIGAAIIDILEFDTSNGDRPTIIQVGNGVYAIAYTGPGNDGFVTTVSIDAAGNIGTSIIDVFEFDPVGIAEPDIIEVGNGIYAIAYLGSNLHGFVNTISIDATGNITHTVIDILDFTDPIFGIDSDIIKISDGVYAIAYKYTSGLLTTICFN